MITPGVNSLFRKIGSPARPHRNINKGERYRTESGSWEGEAIDLIAHAGSPDAPDRVFRVSSCEGPWRANLSRNRGLHGATFRSGVREQPRSLCTLSGQGVLFRSNGGEGETTPDQRKLRSQRRCRIPDAGYLSSRSRRIRTSSSAKRRGSSETSLQVALGLDGERRYMMKIRESYD